MHFYQLENSYLFSFEEYPFLAMAEEKDVVLCNDTIYFLKRMPVLESRKHFCLSDTALLYSNTEDLSLLFRKSSEKAIVPQWLLEKIDKRSITVINTEYIDWQDILSYQPPKKWRINLAGLGDVGGTLLVGLRLLGGDCIESIGIYDRDINKVDRWEYELNQISDFHQTPQPVINAINYDEIFNCDMFVFCIAARVPAIGEEGIDVRMIQFEENSKIISEYATLARNSNFKGIFAVVSDPVDPLCKTVLNASNKNSNGVTDYKGLSPEQIRGYGLGVMNARALYYAGKNTDLKHYFTEGRAYGPHGEDLVIADSTTNYNHEQSLLLTEKARTANLEVRRAGFKPYVAPALSSGALSLLATIRGEWHYSATYMGGVYMGAKNRLLATGTEVECLDLPPLLIERLSITYNRLRSLL